MYFIFYISDIFQEDFTAIHENNIALCDIYSEYFLEPEPDEPLIEEPEETVLVSFTVEEEFEVIEIEEEYFLMKYRINGEYI